MTTPYKRRKVDRSNDCLHEDPILRPNHKIFLSHSGAQKEEFVEQLCVDLERRLRFPFFDKRPSSLPKGERFPRLIKDAVAQCEMMVVVVSEEYFTSKWPMIELHAFMQASVKNKKMKILPLFFGLDVDEFSNTCRQEGWFEVWEKMAKVDEQGRIKVDEWKQCLKLINPFNGMVYNRDSKEVVAYRQEIVSNICKAIPPDVKLDELHVQGRSKLCKVVRQHFENIQDSTKISSVHVMGLYGVGGIGKTQLCKIMCNDLDGDFDGKVCHVESCNQSEHELVKKILTALTNTSVEVVQEVGKDKCRDVLLNDMIWKQKTFLAIDNVWDDSNSLEQANLFLRAPFVEGSWVIVTSRFRKTLISLDIDKNACFEMPELDKDHAKNLFLYYATRGKKFESTEDVDAIEECIKSCYFGKGESQGSHYHPLSLKALGIFLQYHGGKGPSFWMKDLQKVQKSSYLREPVNPLFTILRSNFDRLPRWEQELFMDVSMFTPTNCTLHWTNWDSIVLMEWLCLVHNEEEDVIEDWLQHLVDSALLEDVDLSSGRVSMHDLYREFAKLESKGKLVPLDMEKRRWVYAEDTFPKELEDEPRNCWESLTRLCISDCSGKLRKPITSLRRIEWRYCTKLVVLNLQCLSAVTGVLNLKDLVRLRSLSMHLYDSSAFESIEGLEGLKSLTFFRMVCKGNRNYMGTKGRFTLWTIEDKLPKVGQLPASLKVLEVSGGYNAAVSFPRDVLALCTNLVTLTLIGVFASYLDLKNCTSLQKVDLQNVKGLKILQGFALELGSSLQLLSISGCSDLVEVSGLDCLVSLQSLTLMFNQQLSKLCSLSSLKRLHTLCCFGGSIDEVPGLDGLVGLKYLRLQFLPQISKLPSLTGLQCLCELTIQSLGISEIPNLNGLEQLETIDACHNLELTNLQGFGNLRALKSLDLSWCESLCRLSGMSKLTNLKELDLCRTQVELHEEDMRMLQGLQLLEPVLVGGMESGYTGGYPTYRLDFRRQKILYLLSTQNQTIPWRYIDDFYQTWTQFDREEKDLHVPPTGYPVGEGFKIQDVEKIWKLVPEPATKIIGTDGEHEDEDFPFLVKKYQLPLGHLLPWVP